MNPVSFTRQVSLLLCLLVTACSGQAPVAVQDILVMGAGDLATAMEQGRVSAETVTRVFLNRIEAIDDQGPALGALIEVNPDAVTLARQLDRQRRAGDDPGPLFGLPVVIKANIDTGDRLATTAGSLALAGHRAADDAQLVSLLRQAGAVILGKSNLSEWANFRGLSSTSGWSSLGGQTRNPYVLDRNPCGSSSGSAVAVAALMTPLAIGTETDGSIVCPAGANGVVGIKPSRGSVSQDGIIPISHTQDIAGPMARSVSGAALLLAVLQGKPADSLMPPVAVDPGGARIGVWRDYTGHGDYPAVERGFSQWLDMLAGQGVSLVDPVTLALPEAIGEAELDVLLYEFKADLNAYLADAGTSPGTLRELIDYNASHRETVMPYFGQELFVMADTMGTLDEMAYRVALQQSSGVTQALLAEVFRRHELDALVAPVNAPAWLTDWENGDDFGLSSSGLAAISGYPSVVVPAGMVGGLPVGLAFIGPPDSEARLLALAAAFEKVRGAFPVPRFIPSLAP